MKINCKFCGEEIKIHPWFANWKIKCKHCNQTHDMRDEKAYKRLGVWHFIVLVIAITLDDYIESYIKELFNIDGVWLFIAVMLVCLAIFYILYVSVYHLTIYFTYKKKKN